jgi:hypothetical protein
MSLFKKSSEGEVSLMHLSTATEAAAGHLQFFFCCCIQSVISSHPDSYNLWVTFLAWNDD